MTFRTNNRRLARLVAIYAGGHLHCEHLFDHRLVPDVAVATIAGDLRGGVLGVAEKDKVGQYVNGFCGRHFRVRHRNMTRLAFRSIRECGALAGFGCRVAVDTLQLERCMALMAEVLAKTCYGNENATSESE